ncbi:hypothetical protein [Streptomyces sp. NPDC058466]|uniref:hypothetical protein n=1 Tax=Streptomyces sp. NPDC058466 TaxID=3346512 RepID=UPI00364CF298
MPHTHATACDHSQSYITTEPQIITLEGERTNIELTATLTAKCSHGHEHVLYFTDVSDVQEAADSIAEWATRHVDSCTGPTALPVAA